MDGATNSQRKPQAPKVAPNFIDNIPLLQVAANSPPASVAGAVAGCIRDYRQVYLQAIGAGAVNQAVKAVAIARGYLAPSGDEIVCIPQFHDIKIVEEERTTIRLLVQIR